MELFCIVDQSYQLFLFNSQKPTKEILVQKLGSRIIDIYYAQEIRVFYLLNELGWIIKLQFSDSNKQYKLKIL